MGRAWRAVPLKTSGAVLSLPSSRGKKEGKAVSGESKSRGTLHRAQQDDGVVSSTSFVRAALQIPDVQRIGIGSLGHKDGFVVLGKKCNLILLIGSSEKGYQVCRYIRSDALGGVSRKIELTSQHLACRTALRSIKGRIKSGGSGEFRQITSEGNLVASRGVGCEARHPCRGGRGDIGSTRAIHRQRATLYAQAQVRAVAKDDGLVATFAKLNKKIRISPRLMRIKNAAPVNWFSRTRGSVSVRRIRWW